ncbi:MAG TPA: 4Fe-4S dicluster domain-containing protein, partial [Thiotrichaceae bacterium]|nr:4Fe-4S dicluster domain-containing protein [Thiotrichaceae bacterium]
TTFVLLITTYLAGGFMREKVCQHVCPYARFQSVMIDKDSLVPTYDYKRGEGQSGRAKPIKYLKDLDKRKEQGVGDCVDCGLCVQVCPVGIDIREGMQYACIQCGLCIDACDNIMDARGWDRGLIRYESENGLDKGKTHFFKLRTYGYGIAIAASLVFLWLSLSGQKLVDGSVRQIRNPLFIMLSDGRIQNRYELKLHNKTMYNAKFDIKIEGISGAELDMGRIPSFEVKPDEIQSLMAKIRKEVTPKDSDNIKLRFILTPTEGEMKEAIIINSQFIAR